MQSINARGNIPHVEKLVVFCTPHGQLVTRLGDQRVAISPDEARLLLDEMLGRSLRFTTNGDNLTDHGRK